LPNVIKRHIETETERERALEDNRLSVTECLGCLRKAWYRRKQPLPLSLTTRWWFYRGNLLDGLWTPLFGRNQVRLTLPLKEEEPIVITGRFDFEDEDGAIADLKTVDNLYWIQKEGAREENIKQVKFYCFCDAKTKGRLYYVSLKDAIRIDLEFDRDDLLATVSEIEERAKILYRALKNNVPPDPLPEGESWECGLTADGIPYCEYNAVCRKSRARKEEEQ